MVARGAKGLALGGVLSPLGRRYTDAPRCRCRPSTETDPPPPPRTQTPLDTAPPLLVPGKRAPALWEQRHDLLPFRLRPCTVPGRALRENSVSRYDSRVPCAIPATPATVGRPGEGPWGRWSVTGWVSSQGAGRSRHSIRTLTRGPTPASGWEQGRRARPGRDGENPTQRLWPHTSCLLTEGQKSRGNYRIAHCLPARPRGQEWWDGHGLALPCLPRACERDLIWEKGLGR